MTSKFIMESFWQHPDGTNCATVAIIKAAILRYGIGKIFKLERRHGYAIVTLKNGKPLIITNAELIEVNNESHIVFGKYSSPNKKKDLRELKDHVKLCFAVMVKYLKEYGYRREEYYQTEAIEHLMGGFNTDHIHELLGLKRKSREVIDLKKRHLSSFKRKKGMVLYSYAHVVAVSQGYFDNYGDLERIQSKIPEIGDEKAKFWYELK